MTRDVGKLWGARFESWLDIPGPQIMGLRHMNVAVHDFKALLHCAIPKLNDPWLEAEGF